MRVMLRGRTIAERPSAASQQPVDCPSVQQSLVHKPPTIHGLVHDDEGPKKRVSCAAPFPYLQRSLHRPTIFELEATRHPPSTGE